MTDDELRALDRVANWWAQPAHVRAKEWFKRPGELNPHHVSILIAEVRRLRALPPFPPLPAEPVPDDGASVPADEVFARLLTYCDDKEHVPPGVPCGGFPLGRPADEDAVAAQARRASLATAPRRSGAPT